MSDKALELLLQEREIRRLLDEHLRITVEKVEAIAGKIENRSDESLAAVDQAKQDLIEAKAAIATELANAKKDIGELAVQRTLSVFSEARNVVLLVGGLAIPLIVGSGLIGYSSLKSSSIAFVDAKIREWMSVSMPRRVPVRRVRGWESDWVWSQAQARSRSSPGPSKYSVRSARRVVGAR